MKIKSLVFSLLAIAIAGMATAGTRDQPSPYVLADIGYSSQDGVPSEVATGTSAGIVLGMPLNRDWAVETGYKNFGSRDLTGTAGTLTTDWEAFTLALVGHTGITPVMDLVGKIGFAHTSVSGSANTANVSLFQNGYVMGVGVDYKINRDFSLRGMYEVYPEFAGSSDNMNNLSIGLKFQF